MPITPISTHAPSLAAAPETHGPRAESAIQGPAVGPSFLRSTSLNTGGMMSRGYWAGVLARPNGYLANLIRRYPRFVDPNLLRELVEQQRPDLLDLACRLHPSAVKAMVSGGTIYVSSTGHPALTRACLAVLKDHGIIVSDAELEAAGPLRNPRFVSNLPGGSADAF